MPNIDEPLARIESSGTVRYYHADALGSIIALTDETGTEVTQYSYEPFGRVNISGEISDNPFQYTGRENDGTGFYYYRARYYDPKLQRFISEDPIRLLGGDTNFFAYVDSVGKPSTEVNLYLYAQNNPIRFIDPFGLSSCEGDCKEFRWKCKALAFTGGVACNTACTAACIWATGGSGVLFCRTACATACAFGTGTLYTYCDRTYEECMGKCKECKNDKENIPYYSYSSSMCFSNFHNKHFCKGASS